MYTVMIRTAGSTDLPILRRRYYEFHEFHALGVPDHLHSLGPFETHDWSSFDKAIDDILNNAGAAILLAELEGVPVGFVEVYLKQDDATNSAIVPHRYGHVQSLFVIEELRGRGIGRQLMDAAQQWARDRGATAIHLDTWEFDAGPLRFYEKNGYRTLKRTLIKALQEEAMPSALRQ
ncbi:MAG: GNAT family N-acetyltransferase [Chloroflexi bacterium]|nr:GNAT family N-acetyltransferase [Chloroflexota bacterium]